MKTYKKVLIKDISYDTDGEEHDLPTEIWIWIQKDLVDEVIDSDDIGDFISNQTGFCHFGYNTQEDSDETEFEEGTPVIVLEK